MAGTKTPTRERAPAKTPKEAPSETPAETPSDQPIPARPAPRAKEAPRTMRELRESREGKAAKRPSRSRPADNVLREGLRLERVPDPSILALFGATGDLAHRKVIPAVYHLWRTNLLPHEFELLALGRRPYDDDEFRKLVREGLDEFSRVLPIVEPAWKSFSKRI